MARNCKTSLAHACEYCTVFQRVSILQKCRGALSCAERAPRPVRRSSVLLGFLVFLFGVADGVAHAADGVLHLAFHLLHLAFGLQLLVAGHLADGILELAGLSLGRT